MNVVGCVRFYRGPFGSSELKMSGPPASGEGQTSSWRDVIPRPGPRTFHLWFLIVATSSQSRLSLPNRDASSHHTRGRKSRGELPPRPIWQLQAYSIAVSRYKASQFEVSAATAAPSNSGASMFLIVPKRAHPALGCGDGRSAAVEPTNLSGANARTQSACDGCRLRKTKVR